MIGSALAALAGALIALLNNYVEPTMGFVVSYKALAIIVLGGLGSVRGTLIASFALGLVRILSVRSSSVNTSIAMRWPSCS